jgi:glycogen synthase
MRVLCHPSRPDIVHTHDWATTPVAFGALDCARVFTIHNLNYGADLIGRAMAAANACTTVSPTYAAEARVLIWQPRIGVALAPSPLQKLVL